MSLFLDSKLFRGRLYFPDTGEVKVLEWRSTVQEALKDLYRQGGLDYIENDRGFVSFPYRLKEPA